MIQQIWSKYSAMSKPAKSAVWFVVCSVLQKGISFITVPIFTRLLTTEQYGIYSLYLSWLQILTIITSLYLYNGVFNNGMTKFNEDRDVYISSMQGLTLTINFVVFIIYFIAHDFWNKILGLSSFMMCLMFIEMGVTPALSFWSGRQRFEYKYKRLVAVTLAKSAVNPILGLIMVSLTENKADARVISIVICEIVFCGYFLIKQFLVGKHFIWLPYWKYALSLAIPLLPHYLSGMILNQGDRIMISHMVGQSEVALYSVAYNIGMLVQMVTSSINNSFIPWMYMKFKSDNFSGIKKTINYLLVFIAAISICLMVVSPEVILIFGSEKYAKAAYVIPPIAASVFFIFLYNILAVPQFYFESVKFLPVSSIISAIVNIGLNYIFIRIYGFEAAGYTTLVCYILYSLGHYLVSRNVLKKSIGKEKLFDTRFIVVLSIIMILSTIGCNFLFDFWYIRYALILLVCITTYLKRREIINLIHAIRSK